ncbi:DUF4393 domain-containing protein [Achromobacter insolitus]|uniref:DUF4393 domain-containing protein n=1 Tax=Achromobacter insolitus TaxID=217204 RepID=UPI0013E29427|nr:DUF4393 domain-containing protein [Achromobacter insolitus]MCP1404555.1 hypothetical protein [Achromobacter insolitus]NGT16902.1 DUF4393 domain-containing protein [Achromobacter insolitus]
MTDLEESNESPISQAAAQTWAAVADKAISAAADSPDVRETGFSLVRSARTLAQTVETCLLPLAAVNFAFGKAREYFDNKFRSKIEEHTGNIPSDSLKEPNPAVAAQALQGLAFSHEESNLEGMYLHLLATAMDGRLPVDAAHPAFAEVIRQLTGNEAALLKSAFLVRNSLPVVELQETAFMEGATESHGHNVVTRYVFGLYVGGVPHEVEGLGVMVDNWIRLGLVTVAFDRNFTAPNMYSFAETRPETIRARANCTPPSTIKIQRGVLEVTEFGRRFAKAVGIV